jgi:hypothetical protein
MTETGSRGQSRRMSLVEAIANVVVGYGLAVLTQILVFPLFGRSSRSPGPTPSVAPLRRSAQVGADRHSRRHDVDQAAWPASSTGAFSR